MTKPTGLDRFVEAQAREYETALTEIENGRKRSHWMWYIFPQIQGLGFSDTSRYYALEDIDEATAFLEHPVLGKRLIEICKALLALTSGNANQIFGSPDDLKLKSSMTLFASVPETDPVFQLVLDRFFGGSKDNKTLQILQNQK